MNKDPWHFQRQDLAASVLALLADGPAQALTMFAPRRAGKTEFLLKDLGPLAQKKGHRAIYASFWQSPLSPLATLLHELEASLQGGAFDGGARPLAVWKLRFSGELLGAKAEMEIDPSTLHGKPPTDLLLYLDHLLHRVSGKHRPTILMFDEVQELARDRNNAPLVAALRTSLDRRSDALRTVFTGSSQAGLKAMFGAREAPFFHFATPVDLPSLDEEFVDHLFRTFKKIARRAPQRCELLSAFDQLHRNPYFFRALVETLLLNPHLAVAEGLEQVRGRLVDELGYPNTWLGINPLQRAVAWALANGRRNLFSRSFRETTGRELGEAVPLSSSRIQAALRKLERLGLADREAGDWALADPEFEAWVQRLPYSCSGSQVASSGSRDSRASRSSCRPTKGIAPRYRSRVLTSGGATPRR